MNLNLSAFCITLLSSFALVSCELTGGSSGGSHIVNPTVDQMAEMEKKWGVQPHTDRSRQLPPSREGDAPVSAPPQTFVPEPVPAPLPQTTVPPVFELPPSATPDQIQKLKN